MPCAAGALLALWLGATTRDGRAGLGRGCALAAVGELAEIGLVHHGHVRLLGKNHLGQLELTVALTERVEVGRLEGVGLLGLAFAELARGFLRGCSLGGRALRRRFRLRHQTFLGFGLPEGPLTFNRFVDWRTSTSAP